MASYGATIEDRDTTSSLSQALGATAAVNAGYFVLDPKSGAPGDPAGIGVYAGKLLSETVAQRPALILRDEARRTQIARLHWTGIPCSFSPGPGEPDHGFIHCET